MINQTIDIWGEIPYNDSGRDGFRPVMDTYVLAGNKERGAVLICPGGGYCMTSEREAEPIAMQFNAAGFHAFVIYYSVAPCKHPQPLLDVSRAMCVIRENAGNWNINPDKIAVCGFSAGGHLTASLGVHWTKPYIQEAPGILKGKNRPDAIILSYPVISSGRFAHQGSFISLLGDPPPKELLDEMSLELQVNENTPPAFLWHTFDDSGVPVENSLLFAQALRRSNIPFEMHIYPEGPHGLSLATEETSADGLKPDAHIATWMPLCIEWLNQLFK